MYTVHLAWVPEDLANKSNANGATNCRDESKAMELITYEGVKDLDNSQKAVSLDNKADKINSSYADDNFTETDI